MEIRAKCKFDFSSIRALTHLEMFRKANPKKRMFFWLVCYTILLTVAIFELIFLRADMQLYIMLGLSMVFPLLGIYLYFLLPRIRFKAMAQMQGTENEYIFCDNLLKVFTKSAKYNGEAEVEYSLLVRAFETSTYFFLFQTNNQAFLVEKATIEGGTVDDVRNKLSFYLKDKYTICKY